MVSSCGEGEDWDVVDCFTYWSKHAESKPREIIEEHLSVFLDRN
jgi:dimeric dUTPase (all-alpha-NTP-PPase superfamily)